MPICTGILSYTFIHLYTYVYVTIVNEKIGKKVFMRWFGVRKGKGKML